MTSVGRLIARSSGRSGDEPPPLLARSGPCNAIKAVRSRRRESAVAVQLGESGRLDEHRSVGARGVSSEQSRTGDCSSTADSCGGGGSALCPPVHFLRLVRFDCVRPVDRGEISACRWVTYGGGVWCTGTSVACGAGVSDGRLESVDRESPSRWRWIAPTDVEGAHEEGVATRLETRVALWRATHPVRRCWASCGGAWAA